jgi:hypothetical protein
MYPYFDIFFLFSYETRIDGETKEKGNLKDDWSFLKPKTIKDPAVSKTAVGSLT